MKVLTTTLLMFSLGVPGFAQSGGSATGDNGNSAGTSGTSGSDSRMGNNSQKRSKKSRRSTKSNEQCKNGNSTHVASNCR